MYNLRYGFIGYRNQSKKLLVSFQKQTKGQYKVYVHNKKNLFKYTNTRNTNYTNNINDLRNCEVIVIASPSNTHFKYINFFKNKAKYIFCEKPGVVNKTELIKIQKFSNNLKKKIYFNFNYLHSDFFNILKKIITTKKYGKIINISINSTHGLSFKKNSAYLKKSDHKNVYNNIYGNLAIHYINLLLNIFGKIQIRNINLYSSYKRSTYDTVSINLIIKKIIDVNIFLSYATIFSKSIDIYFNNGLIQYNNDKVYENFPRDTFDKKGNFTKPKSKTLYSSIDLSQESINHSIKYFLQSIKNKKNFKKEFDQMVITNQLIQNSIKKIYY